MLIGPQKTQADHNQREINAAKRILAVREARKDFLAFVKLMMPDPEDPDNPDKTTFVVGPQHKIIAQELTDVVFGKTKRLIVQIPPRHTKSEACTRMLPAWLAGHFPNYQQILAGASTEFAVNEFGRKVRNILLSPAYKQVFPASNLDDGSQAVDNLVFSAGGNIKSIGKGAQIIGRGAHLLVIDDPIANSEEAASVTEQDKIWEWFTGTCINRLMPNGRVIIVMHRWGVDDLISRLIDPTNKHYKAHIAKKWKLVKIPAVIYDKELADNLGLTLKTQTDPFVIEQFGKQPCSALWEQWYDLSFFAEVRAMNPRDFEAKFQGNPSLESGEYFHRDWIKTYQPNELPYNLRYYMAADFAISQDKKADKTCIMMVGVDEKGIIWVLPDIFWKRIEPVEILEAIVHMIKSYSPMLFWAEKEKISMALGPFMYAKMIEEKAYCVVVEQPTKGKSKEVRATSIRGLIQLGRVRFPAFAYWFEDAMREMMMFPNEKGHDDFVDSLAWIGVGLQYQIPATRHVENKEVRPGTLAFLKKNDRMLKTQANVLYN
jgi:predicted phage terminase large subunit-like protein